MIDGPPLPNDLAHAYLERLGVDVSRGNVDLDVLTRLQQAHVERVVYETIDMVLGRPPGISPLASAARILSGKGGYCYHLNGAFSALLAWLDVDVTRHHAGVQRRSIPEPVGVNRNHMALTVRLADESRWLVDVGLGDGPAEPLPLVPGMHEQAGFRYELAPSSCGEALWRFEHDPRGSFAGFELDVDAAASVADFAEMHAMLSTRSGFATTATAQRWVAGRVVVLRGCVLTEVGPNGADTTDVTDEDAWWTVVLNDFGLSYGGLSSDERSRLWSYVADGHAAWVEAGRP